jgi:arsenite-transporting ATPase
MRSRTGWRPGRTPIVSPTRRPPIDAQGKALLEEDLRSPCTEEIAVFERLQKL